MTRLICLLALLAVSLTAAPNLEIYVIDVEGGKSVLLVSPSGQSLLFDAGWPAGNNRLASTERIVDAVEAAGLRRIDFLVISHFDIDHIGDIPLLAAKVPIEHIFDHGEYLTTNAQAAERFAAYAALRDKIGHTVLHVGDKIPIKGVEIRVLSVGGQLITKPLPNAGARNALCDTYKQQDTLATDFEDNQSIGLLITSGKFRMLDLADLEAHYSHDLVCPRNLIGAVDVYNVNVHGQFKGIAPELVGALHAPVIIQANGAKKGADAQTWAVLRAAPGLHDIWQLHQSLNAGKDANPPDDFIANLEPADTFKWIQISAAKDGAFQVTNTRNGFSKSYGK
jgi:beta-lactamase superfamily II metal-dependent hydrolase